MKLFESIQYIGIKESELWGFCLFISNKEILPIESINQKYNVENGSRPL